MPLAANPPSARRNAPARIGRYRIVRELGRGAQGCVYLAHDEHLGRCVAIKTLPAGSASARASALLAEARTTCQLRHPNIVTLHDAFEHDGIHCTVLEYVEGETLATRLRRQGKLDPAQAVTITIQILDGLAYAHQRGVVHRDIKPANLLIDAAGVARIMDFGLAAPPGTAGELTLSGTASYMAPELFDAANVERGADVFSVGMTLYQMLTGRTAVEGGNVFQVMHRIAHQPFEPPSAHHPGLDEGLDQIVMRALSKDPTGRYADAAEMRLALESYRGAAMATASSDEPAGNGTGAVAFLLKRIGHKTGFPALSQTIRTINRITATDAQNVQALTAVLLKDFALTNRVLRMVNSPRFGQFGGNVSTISRAVMILGFDAVRSLAVTMALFEHLQNKGQAARLRDELIATLFAGLAARRIACLVKSVEPEESFVCGVFHQLGRILAAYYFFDESVEVARRMQQGGQTEAIASAAVLGASYEEIGIAMARHWNLPANVIASMRHPTAERVTRAATAAQRLQLIAVAATELARACTLESAAERERGVAQLAGRFGDALGLDARRLTAVAVESAQELLADAAKLLGDSGSSALCAALRRSFAAPVADDEQASAADAGTLEHAIAQTQRIGAAPAVTSDDSVAVLSAGIHDITDALVGAFNLNDVLRIIAETMYRGMRFSRVLLFMRDVGRPTMSARIGYGPDVDRLIPSLSIPIGAQPDVHSVVLARNVDVLVNNIDADSIRARVPAWYRAHRGARGFVLLPLVVDGKPIGLFQGERDQDHALVIEPREMALLKTLRNQAVLALRQRR